MGIEDTTNFKAIIIVEEFDYVNPTTYKSERLTVYLGQVLEWDICSQGYTVEEVAANLKWLLLGQKLLNASKKYAPIKEAPEEWQRVRTCGDRMVHVRKEYIEAFGVESYKIVDRIDIDIGNSK